MSSSSHDVETERTPATGLRHGDPFHNPTYPVRDHILECAELEKAVRSCTDRVNSARQKLNSVVNHPKQASFVRLYLQMLGARDQLAEAARRMPLETGDLYHEDKERFEQALAALDRLWQSWEKAGD